MNRRSRLIGGRVRFLRDESDFEIAQFDESQVRETLSAFDRAGSISRIAPPVHDDARAFALQKAKTGVSLN